MIRDDVWMRMVGVVVLGMMVGGCSLAFVHGPPTAPQTSVECTRTWTLPVVDYALAATTFVATVFVVRPMFEYETTGRDINWNGLKVLGLATAAALPWYISGEVGRHRVKRCRALSETEARR